MKQTLSFFLLVLGLSFIVGGCAQSPTPSSPGVALAAGQAPGVEFTLTTGMADGKMAFLGLGGEIDGLPNPDLIVPEGVPVRILLVNGDGTTHDLALPEWSQQTPLVTRKGQMAELLFTAKESGTFAYFCTLPGHRQAGMEGRLIVRTSVP